jgi:hypothetical protein
MAAMSTTVLSKEAAQAGLRLQVTRYQWFCKQLAERFDACAGTHMGVRIELIGLEPHEIRRIRRAYVKEGWKSRIVSDQNDGRRYLLFN